MVILDVLGTDVVKDCIASPTSYGDGDSKGLMITLIVFLIINILASIAKYFFDRSLKKQDIKISKKLAINNLSINTEAELFLKLENLKNYQKDEKHQLLDSIIEIEDFLSHNRLFICKKIIGLTNEYLDYFKKVVSNFNEKDIRQEKAFTTKFSKLYYGQ